VFEQFITRQNDREAVFHPPLYRLLLLPFAALFGCSDLYILLTPPFPNGLEAWVIFIILVLFATAVTVVLTASCFPSELRLDFAQRTYASRMGLAPFLIERFGSFNDIQCVFIEQTRGGPAGLERQYRIGIALRCGVRSWLSPLDRYFPFFFGRGYYFIVTRNQEAAKKYAEDTASKMAVPYFGLLPYGDELPDST